jgi:tryptophanyl-tRNA synthetase
MDQQRNIIVTGAKPSGQLHLGNYVGMAAQAIDLQEMDADRFVFVADYHQLAEPFDPASFRQVTLGIATDLLAMGIDPERTTLFIQSDVPEHTELAWIFTTLTPVSFLERMTQYKDKALVQHQNVNAGLLQYPVLQAADILLYRATQVPVGQDQVQHVELTRDIAGFFNNKFGETFVQPKALLTKVPKVQSLADPLKKMSKSLGEKSYIAVFDEPEVIADKLKRAVTTPEGITNLLSLLEIFGSGTIDAERYANNNVALKDDAAQAIAHFFAPAREKRRQLQVNAAYVHDVLAEGAKKARAIAQATMEEVRTKIGIR